MSETTNLNTENATAESEKISYTKEELDALIQKESDKRVSQALKTVEKKNEEKLKESQKLANMNAQEKFQYELEQRERALADREKQLVLSENKNEACKVLEESGVPIALVDFVVDESAEVMQKNIKTLTDTFKKAVKEEVEKRIGQKAPVHASEPAAMSKDAFKKLSLSEQNKIYLSDRELYDKLTK